MEAVNTSETTVNFYESTQRSMAEDGRLQQESSVELRSLGVLQVIERTVLKINLLENN
jgi:hypothetical protein